MSRITRTDCGRLQSAAVEHHGFVFTQAVVARDTAKPVGGQIEDILQQIDALLETHGTDKTRMLQAQIWLKSLADRPVLDELWGAWLDENAAPALAVIEAAPGEPGSLVQIMIMTCK